MNDLEKRRQRIEFVVKLFALAAVGFFASAYVVLAVKGLLGLIAIAVVATVAINLAPWFAMKVANWRLKALKHEASLNPIETLENQYQERVNALATFRSNIQTFHAEVQNFYSELQEFKQAHPDGSPQMEMQYGKMRALLAARSEKYKQAQSNLKHFADVIERKRSEWKLAQAAAKMTKAAGVGEDFISKLMSDTALDSVTTSLNTAFAELEVSLLDEQPAQLTPSNVKAIPAQTGPPTLDLEFEPVPEMATVKASV